MAFINLGAPEYKIAGYDAPNWCKRQADLVLASGDDAAAAVQTALAFTDEVRLDYSMNATTTMNFLTSTPGLRKALRSGRGAKWYTPDTASSAFAIGGSRTPVTLAFTGTSLGKGGYTYSHSTAGLATTLPGGSLVEIVSNQSSLTDRPDQDFLGEMNEVSRITPPTDTTVTFVEPLHDTYDLSTHTVTVYLVTPLGLHVDGEIEFIGPGGIGHPITTSTLRHRLFEARWCRGGTQFGLSAQGKYARDGISFASCFNIDATVDGGDVRDLSATTFEGYLARILGGSHIKLRVRGARSRHEFDAHNPQNTGLPGGQNRSIARHLDIEVEATGSLSAAGSTHGGAQDVRMKLRAVGCSGGMVFRGRDGDLDIRVIGSKHDLGDYTTNQGYDHALRVGEPNSVDSTQSGPSGTNLRARVWCDFTGAPSVTAHGIYSEAPLINTQIELLPGSKMTGIGVWARGDSNADSTIRVAPDCSSQFTSTPKNLIRIDPGHPASYTQTKRMRLAAANTGNLRDTAIYMIGASSGSNDDIIIEHLRVPSIGTIDATKPMVEFGAGAHGTVIINELDLPVTNRTTAILKTGTVANLLIRAEQRYADGAYRPGVDFLASGEYREETNTGGTTITLAAGDNNLMRGVEVEGCGQTFDYAEIGVSTAMAGATTVNCYCVIFPDDGTGKPLFSTAPIAWSNSIDITATGPRTATWAGGANVSAGVFTEPMSRYIKVFLPQWTGTPSTYAILRALTAVVHHVAATMNGTAVVTSRNWTSQAGVSTAPSATTFYTSATRDTSNRPTVSLHKA